MVVEVISARKDKKMMFRLAIYLMIFLLMQATASVFFKWGSTSESRWIWGFLLGNLFGFSSIWLLMLLYKSINPNIVLGIAGGGVFLLNQITLALVFKSKVAPMQMVGIMAVVIGMIAIAIGRPREDWKEAQQITPLGHSLTLPDGR